MQFLQLLSEVQSEATVVDPLYGAVSTVVLILSADFVRQVPMRLADPVEQYPCH